MNVTTKFTIATEGGTKMLLKLTKDLAYEKFSSILDQRTIESYIEEQFNPKYLVSEMNSMSNQWLTVYVDDNIAGYAKITSKGKHPLLLENKRSLRIADFAILEKYPEEEVKKTLLEKCLSVCKRVEAVWVNEYLDNPVISFFESNGFQRQPGTSQHDELNLPATYLVYQHESHQ
ncbi:GNAT family N-acetyltransferase [Pedobacter miscanthi]|uniref:N-acetyltransferase n=1 Tax=Pedobacter miscanthi TaxID=2259170 RepID=A0A366LDB7_9SPHI|nr:GNAT family N-acetyltransferase [Pedobacter miscanthi]RBQ11479.1 N-acetyltransferase [Pedobacter miscanthi]